MQSKSLPVSAQPPVATSSLQPLVLDVRPVFARDGSPCTCIDEALARLEPGQNLLLVAPFEPIPLFAKLGALGFGYCSAPQTDGSWQVEFFPTASVPAVGCRN